MRSECEQQAVDTASYVSSVSRLRLAGIVPLRVLLERNSDLHMQQRRGASVITATEPTPSTRATTTLTAASSAHSTSRESSRPTCCREAQGSCRQAAAMDHSSKHAGNQASEEADAR
jgi:hypothetical protein